MATQRYYKSTEKTIIAAVNHYDFLREALLAKATNFANHFDGIAVMSMTIHSYDFHGLCFTPRKPADLWTTADAKSFNVQKPRDRLKSPINQDLKQPHANLKNEWQAKYSEIFADGVSVKKDDLQKAIGYDWGVSILSGDRFCIFKHAGAVFITTQQKLQSAVVEITASEFEQARIEAERELNARKAGEA